MIKQKKLDNKKKEKKYYMYKNNNSLFNFLFYFLIIYPLDNQLNNCIGLIELYPNKLRLNHKLNLCINRCHLLNRLKEEKWWYRQSIPNKKKKYKSQ
jgi:hypothetical protein